MVACLTSVLHSKLEIQRHHHNAGSCTYEVQTNWFDGAIFGSMELWHRYFVILNAFALGILVLGQIFESGRFLFIRVGQAFP